MPLQHTVPAPPWNGAEHGIPAHVTKEGGYHDGAIPPSKPPHHLVAESPVSRNCRHPLPAIQWGEEKSGLYCVKGPPQRFQQARIPFQAQIQGLQHQPNHQGLACVHYFMHPRVPNSEPPQPAPHGGPRGIEHSNVCLQLCILLCCRCPFMKDSK